MKIAAETNDKLVQFREKHAVVNFSFSLSQIVRVWNKKFLVQRTKYENTDIKPETRRIQNGTRKIYSLELDTVSFEIWKRKCNLFSYPSIEMFALPFLWYFSQFCIATSDKKTFLWNVFHLVKCNVEIESFVVHRVNFVSSINSTHLIFTFPQLISHFLNLISDSTVWRGRKWKCLPFS